jgi:hypothetical protein
MNMATETLRRYTQLPSLFHLLSERKLTLLDPNSWDDKNDSYFLSQYKVKRQAKTVLALCFSSAPETYHHWSVFGEGSAGICIQFKRAELLAAIDRQPGIRHRDVKYLRLTAIHEPTISIKQLPFTKRYPFGDEKEWRIVYESKVVSEGYHNLSIPLSTITRITLSPWLPEALKEHVKERIRSISGCSKLEITRSTLISNERWKRMGDAAV